MQNELLERVIESMVRTSPIIRRKLQREVFKTVMQRFGADMGPHHLMILLVLQEYISLNSSEICDETAIAKPQMTQSIDKLITLGMVERHPDTKDRRKINITLTPKGRDTVERLDRIMADVVRVKLSVLSDDELETLAGAFNTIADTFAKLP